MAGDSSSSGGPHNFQPEDARAAQWRRYVGDWTIAQRTVQDVTLHSRFEFPDSGSHYLSHPAPESAWAAEPWGYDKAYLVLLLQDENAELNNNWIPDPLQPSPPSDGTHDEKQAFTIDGVPKMILKSARNSGSLAVTVNGVPKTIHALITKRNQVKGFTRCFFVDLGAETKPRLQNEVEVKLPIQTGLVFSGAYLDLPDQTPLGP